MDELIAIPTKYNHYTFRSRMEARWAVFFDGMGIKWDYEKEGFKLEDILYLPDFELLTFQGGCFVEVKPVEFTEEETEKANLLVIKSNRPLWKAIGVPDYKEYDVIFPVGDGTTYTLKGIPNVGVASDRMFIDSGPLDLFQLSDKYVMALENSRYFKFPHG